MRVAFTKAKGLILTEPRQAGVGICKFQQPRLCVSQRKTQAVMFCGLAQCCQPAFLKCLLQGSHAPSFLKHLYRRYVEGVGQGQAKAHGAMKSSIVIVRGEYAGRSREISRHIRHDGCRGRPIFKGQQISKWLEC